MSGSKKPHVWTDEFDCLNEPLTIEQARKGIEAIMNNGWISVEDELPETKVDVILHGIKCPASFVGFLHENGKDFACDNANEFIPISYVSHWQPLPAPPLENFESEPE